MDKPPCPICQSTRYTRDNLGFYICESEHQLQGYQRQEIDVYEDGFVGCNVIRKKRKEKKFKRGSLACYNDELRLLILKCYGYIIQVQTHYLIKHCEAPKELETVVKELWLLYVSSQKQLQIDFSKVRLDATSDTDSDNEGESGKHHNNTEHKRAQNKTAANNGEFNVNLDFEDEEIDIADLVDGLDDNGGDDNNDNNPLENDESDIEQQEPNDRVKLKRYRRTARDYKPVLNLFSTLAFVSIGCLWVRQPMLPVDLHRIINHRFANLPDLHLLINQCHSHNFKLWSSILPSNYQHSLTYYHYVEPHVLLRHISENQSANFQQFKKSLLVLHSHLERIVNKITDGNDKDHSSTLIEPEIEATPIQPPHSKNTINNQQKLKAGQNYRCYMNAREWSDTEIPSSLYQLMNSLAYFLGLEWKEILRATTYIEIRLLALI